jgi:hypothetical protein
MVFFDIAAGDGPKGRGQEPEAIPRGDGKYFGVGWFFDVSIVRLGEIQLMTSQINDDQKIQNVHSLMKTQLWSGLTEIWDQE